MSRLVLKEENSISQIVKKLTVEVLNDIKQDIIQQPYFISKDFKMKFKENKISLTFKHINEQLSDIDLEYTIYLPENRKAFEYFNETIAPELNSSYNDEKKLLYVVGCMYGGRFLKDMNHTLFHELEHYFQYEMGMNKNRDLYSSVEEYLKRGKEDIDAYYVGLATYYSFVHEQDAYANQYYSLLMSSDNEIKPEEYEYFQWFERAYDVVSKRIDKKTLLRLVLYLGFKNLKVYFERLDSARKRFLKKLSNARLAALVDKRLRKMSMNEAINHSVNRMFREILLEEKEGRQVFKYERYMNFNRD